MAIAILDTDVLIDMLDVIAKADKRAFKGIMEYMALRFEKVWIPKTVENEFSKSKKDKYRYRRFINKYEFVRNCPISIGKNEINILLNEIDKGEADAILQAQKIELYKEFKQKRTIFISNDRTAINFASENLNIETLHYEELKKELREAGYIV